MISSNYKGMILLLYCSFDHLKLSQKLRGERGEGRGEGRGMLEVVD